VYWTNYPCAPYNIFTNEDFAISEPADLNGLQIITSSAPMQQFITENGGAPEAFPVTDYATTMNTKAVDGIINHANVIAAFGVSDFIQGATVFGESGTAMSLMTMCFSEAAWNDLPADLQQLFLDEKEALRDNQGGWELGANQANLESWPNVITLDDTQMKVWQDAFADILTSYVDEIEASGADQAWEVYEDVQARIAAA
jgi:TRAP-type C4-dicarboxylate transport system substrate-binding protein